MAKCFPCKELIKFSYGINQLYGKFHREELILTESPETLCESSPDDKQLTKTRNIK